MPLTNSLYVKGQLSQPDRVLVDIGTGFYVEKVSVVRDCICSLSLQPANSLIGCQERLGIL